MKKLIYVLLTFSWISLLTGCATPQGDVPVSDEFWQNPKPKVTVANTKTEEPMVYQAGAQGILDYGINKAVNSDINDYLKKTDVSWYHNTRSNFVAQLQQRHISAKAHDVEIDRDEKKYPEFAKQVNSDHLLVIKLEALGAKRNYEGFIPLGKPQAYCVLIGELLNTKTNKIVWYHKADVTEPVQGEWDQPPNYPNLTTSLKVAINSAQQELMDSFFSGH